MSAPITYCRIRYTTRSGRESVLTYRWGTRYMERAKALRANGCTILEILVLRGRDWISLPNATRMANR